MSSAATPLGPAVHAGEDSSVIVFAVADERFAIPAGLVEAIAPGPLLSRIPHASPAFLGVGMVAGQVLPVLDGSVLGSGPVRHYDDKTGEIVKIAAAGGSVGLWVDAVERLAGGRRGLATI